MTNSTQAARDTSPPPNLTTPPPNPPPQLAKHADSIVDDGSVRLSVAFNVSGHPITKSTTFSGIEIVDAEGAKYVVDALEFSRLLASKFGSKPRHCKKEVDGAGRKGILVFQGIKSLKNGTYVDLWDGDRTATAAEHWTDATEIHLYELVA